MEHWWWKPFNFFGDTSLGPQPQVGDYITDGEMTPLQSAEYNQELDNWNIKNAERRKRQEIFQRMAQTAGPTPPPYTSDAGIREAVASLSPIQVEGKMAPSDPMARYGRPRKWPYLQSIVNMGKV